MVLSGLFAAGAKEEAAPSGPVSIKIATWTSNQSQLDLLGSFVKEFAEKEGIEIDVTFESIAFAEYNTKLSLELQGSDAPDVFWVLETSAPAFIQSGLLAELDSAMAEYNPDDFSKPAMQLWQKGGKTYAVPFSTSPFFVIYNEDLFEMGWKADHYSEDIESARREGEVAGRNANIKERMSRRQAAESMPPALSGQGVRNEEQKPAAPDNDPWMLG